MLGVLISRLGALEGGYVVFGAEKDSDNTAAFETINFEEELLSVFYQIVHYGKSDLSVMLALLKALRYIMEKASQENRKAVLAFVDAIWSKIDPALLEGGYDRALLERERADIQALITAGV